MKRWLGVRPLPRRRLAAASTGGGRTSLVGLVLVTAISVPLFALGTKAFVNAAAAGNARGRCGSARSSACSWIASVAIGHLVRPVAFELGDLNGLAFDAELIALGGGSAGPRAPREPGVREPARARAHRRRRPLPGDARSSRASPGSCSSCS